MTWETIPVLGVRDVRRAVDHYRDVLGFSCSEDSIFAPPGHEAVYALLTRDGCTIHLQIRRHERASTREAIEGDAYVIVPDVDALFEELRGRGARIHREPMDEAYGMRDFTVEDPDGNRIAFATPLPG